MQFLLGFALQLNARWDEAAAAFQRHESQNPFQDPDPLYNTADDRITQCRNGKALQARAIRAEVMNMGARSTARTLTMAPPSPPMVNSSISPRVGKQTLLTR